MSLRDASTLIDRARAGGLSLGSAESITGGAVSAAMTAVAGASDVWLGAVVAYSSGVKHGLLDVPDSVLEAAGPVSADTALAMAHGARLRLAVDFAVSTTGVAGPEPHGGKDVGAVVVAVVGPGQAHAQEFQFSGDRGAIVRQAVDAALGALYEAVGGSGPHPPGNMEQV